MLAKPRRCPACGRWMFLYRPPGSKKRRRLACVCNKAKALCDPTVPGYCARCNCKLRGGNVGKLCAPCALSGFSTEVMAGFEEST